ncbi:sulfite exporter TauE/SafE family protein 3-like [Heracleum sosnowskyi]|uniref:Sulfite exporter TauE/SafE family protein 3-like n=1 Tax=Heracleum sosnowskyi TaxID=360622 RepID=A0AAD8MD04_9APIA|nr:sulfite exporter TauE/SafE family protein 3-like [Heracleum sosnowskyi]
MEGIGGKWKILRSAVVIIWSFGLAAVFVSAERSLKKQGSNLIHNAADESETNNLLKVANFLWQSNESGYQHVWPEMQFNWQIIVAAIIGFFGASFGSVGGVGGGGIFIPMLTLVIGFDSKSATAISKCMIMGAAVSTVYYNLKLRHPTIDMPIIDYDLVLLIQPMLMLGISIGVTFNVLFADWMVTVLLIVLFLVISTKAFLRGVDTWKGETILKKEAAKRREDNGNGGDGADYRLLPGGPDKKTESGTNSSLREVSVLENVCWKEFGLLCFVWVAFLAVQITKNYTANCSTTYWVLNFLQVPVSVGVSLYEAVGLYTGRRVIASNGESGTHIRVGQLFVYCFFGVLAGVVGGLLGLGGGFIMAPLFLELGIPPQVTNATATFGMMFSASMSVVEYYLLKRFPVPYALYFIIVATIAAFIGQDVVRRVIDMLGRASIIIFILASTIFISALSLGGVGIVNMVGKIQRHEYMGFENLCK